MTACPLEFDDRGALRLLSRLILKTATNISQCIGGTKHRLELRRTMFKCDDVIQDLCDVLWAYPVHDYVISILDDLDGPISLVFAVLEAINMIIEQDSNLVQNGRRWYFDSQIVDCIGLFILDQTHILRLASERDTYLLCVQFDLMHDSNNKNLDFIFNKLGSAFPYIQLFSLAGKRRFDTAHESAQLSFYNMNEDGKEGDHYESCAIGELASEPCLSPLAQPLIPQPVPFYYMINRWQDKTSQGKSDPFFPLAGPGLRQALLGFLALDGLDVEKCIMIGLCRDLVQLVAEETWARSDASERKKRDYGQHACWYIVNELRQYNPKTAQKVFGLWLDCENGLSEEGRFMKQIDSLDLALRGDENTTTFGNMELQGLHTNVALKEHQRILGITISPLIQEVQDRYRRKQTPAPVIFIIGDMAVDWRPYVLDWSAHTKFQVQDGDQLCQVPGPCALPEQRDFIHDSTSRGIPLPPWLAVDALWSKLAGISHDDRLWTLVHNFPKCMAQVEHYEDKVQPMYFSIIINQVPKQPVVPQCGNQIVPDAPCTDVIKHLRQNSDGCKEVEFGHDFEQQMKQALTEIVISSEMYRKV